jgi:hypothetical protein
MEDSSEPEVANHTLLGFHALLTPKGDVHLTLRYGVPMAAGEITFELTAKQAGRLAQGLLLTIGRS